MRVNTRATPEDTIDLRQCTLATCSESQSHRQAVPSSLARSDPNNRLRDIRHGSPGSLSFSRQCSECRAHPEGVVVLWNIQYESPSWLHFVVGIPSVRHPSEVMWRHVWVGFALILICGEWSFHAGGTLYLLFDQEGNP